MNAEFVNPFIESIYELFNTMLGAKVARTGIGISDGQKRSAEIMALIGFSGAVRGTVGLALPSATCAAMVTRLLGEAADTSDETINDTIAEMVNIVAGSAKAKISVKIKQTLELSLPVVVTGKQYEVYSPSQAAWLEIPFSSELGDLVVRLTFQD
jgi:chemotaxis protein CheX